MKQNAITITRVNRQSWFAIKYNNHIIHLDPGYAGTYENQGIDESIFEKKANYILISHNHKDHLRTDMLSKIADYNTIIIAPPICRQDITSSFIELIPFSTYSNQDFKVLAVPAYNTPEGRSIRKYHHKGDYNGYIIELGETRIYFAGDTDVIDEMKTFGHIDIAILPIGGTYVMDLDESIIAASMIKPKLVIPMHQADASLESYQEKLNQKGLSCHILHLGDSISF